MARRAVSNNIKGHLAHAKVVNALSIKRLTVLRIPLALALSVIVLFTGCGPGQGSGAARTVVAQAIKAALNSSRYATIIAVDDAMAPRFRKGDVVLIDRSEFVHRPVFRGSTVVFRPPIYSTRASIRRVFGYPGDKLAFHAGRMITNGSEHYPWFHPAYELTIKNYQIFVNGKPLSALDANLPPQSQWPIPDRLPPGCFLVFGENLRTTVKDSHTYGCAQFKGYFWSGLLRGLETGLYGEAIKTLH
jgi:signal peptidase I